MILVDSSAWVEFLRATGSPAHLHLRSALKEKVDLASTDVVVMEILAGARDDADRDRLRRLLYGLRFLAVEDPQTMSARPSFTDSVVVEARLLASSPTA